eukprot:12213386-Karenia_brevis.AAC.1
MPQGRVLSPLLFNILINEVTAAIRRINPGVFLGPDTSAPRIPILLYADDMAILSESPTDLQSAIDAVEVWARQWRF